MTECLQKKLSSKSLRELEEVARQLVDSLVWGNRKDIGKKFPRTPLNKKEYSIASKAFHTEQWVKLEDVEEAVRDIASSSQDAIEDFKAEIEDQKYNLAQSSNVEMFVIDLDNLNTAIKNLEVALQKLLVGSSPTEAKE